MMLLNTCAYLLLCSVGAISAAPQHICGRNYSHHRHVNIQESVTDIYQLYFPGEVTVEVPDNTTSPPAVSVRQPFSLCNGSINNIGKISWPPDGSCHYLNTQGPCAEGFWLVVEDPPSFAPKCARKLCPYPDEYYWKATGRCVYVNSTGYCRGNMELTHSPYGDGICSCPSNPPSALWPFRKDEEPFCVPIGPIANDSAICGDWRYLVIDDQNLHIQQGEMAYVARCSKYSDPLCTDDDPSCTVDLDTSPDNSEAVDHRISFQVSDFRCRDENEVKDQSGKCRKVVNWSGSGANRFLQALRGK